MGYISGCLDMLVLLNPVWKWEGVRICELGDQRGCYGIFNDLSARQYFEKRGADYVSIDLNGNHGALVLDLTEPITGLGEFDLITNLGTSEHVEPLEKQYEVFKNIHDLCKVGGHMINYVPHEEQWKTHAPARYTKDFFDILAFRSGHENIRTELTKEGMVRSVTKKTSDSFVSREDFPIDEIMWDKETSEVDFSPHFKTPNA